MTALALGTAQFGMAYGINNTRGRIPVPEVSQILTVASERGVRMLDTATAYGESECILGEVLSSGHQKFDIVTKIRPESPDAVARCCTESLQHLRQTALYGCLLHDFAAFRADPSLWRALEEVARRGTVQRIGFSLYYPDEWGYLRTAGIRPGIVQIPLNVFDRRFAPLIPDMRARGTMVHVRSLFLQGLAFRSPETLPSFFSTLREPLTILHRVARETQTSVATVCLAFALRCEPDALVVGVDSLQHFQDILESLQRAHALDEEVLQLLNGCATDDLDMIIPSRWRGAG